MQKIFYCPKCKCSDVDFEFDDIKQHKQITYRNIRDGFGEPITHIFCPVCGYELSGYMNATRWLNMGMGLKDAILYASDTIAGYSDNSYCDTEKLLSLIREHIK